MTPSIPEETELDNAYQKTLTTGYKTDIRPNDKGKNPVQMKEWSILSDHVKYITSDKHKTFNNLSIDQLNYRQNISLFRELQEKELLSTNLNFGSSSTKLQSEYLDMYEGIYAEIVSSDKFDEDTDLSTMYLGQMDMTKDMEVKADGKFSHNGMWLNKRKTNRWHQMWHISRHRHEANPICPSLTLGDARACIPYQNSLLPQPEFKFTMDNM